MNESSKISTTQLDGEYRSVAMFVENAKTYIQLATGALVLSVALFEKNGGSPNAAFANRYVLVSWLCWLLAILAGVTYQYCVAKYLEELEHKNGSLFYDRAGTFILFKPWVENPYRLYGALLVFFYLGTVWFAGVAAVQLMK